MTVALVANIARPISSAISTAFAMDNYGKLNDYGKLGAWSPLSLFAASEVGAWYDPSDFSTMFQDSAGTSPVTAVGQPVGLILDKSKGLVLGSELVTNGDFSVGTGWNLSSATITGGKLSCNSSTSWNVFANQTMPVPLPAGTQEVTITISNYVSGALSVGVTVGATAEVYVSGNGTFVLFMTPTGVSYDIQLYGRVGGFVGDVDNVSIKTITGNHAFQATAASRPVLRQDGSGKYYLEFDGVDDSLATAAIDFTATDKMSIYTGLHKASDAAVGMLYELSADAFGNGGAFHARAPDSANPNYETLIHGTSYNYGIYATYTAPITNVLTSLLDISAAAVQLQNKTRIDGVDVTATTGGSIAGSGNFGNWPLYIGSRAGSSLRFNGRIYSMIIRGVASTEQEITDTENWIAAKTGVTI